MSKERVADIAAGLIARESLSPHDKGCQDVIRNHLDGLGFEISDLSHKDTTNTWAFKEFGKGPMFIFAGHTDIVPTGSRRDWRVNGKPINPFNLTQSGDQLYGRGVADMKGAIACMMVVTEQLLKDHDPKSLFGSIGFLITSDEEDKRTDGTQHVVKKLNDGGLRPDYAVVGEASSIKTVGDQIYYGRRGSYHAIHKIRGITAHIAKNTGIDAAEIAVNLLNRTYCTSWEKKPDRRFPPTGFRAWLIHSGAEVENQTPADAEMRLNWRTNPASRVSDIRRRFNEMANDSYGEIAGNKKRPRGAIKTVYRLSGEPYGTPIDSPLIAATQRSLKRSLDISPELSGGGGTSDGGFIASLGTDVIELGLPGMTIHEANEHIPSKSLGELVIAYKALMEEILIPSTSSAQ